MRSACLQFPPAPFQQRKRNRSSPRKRLRQCTGTRLCTWIQNIERRRIAIVRYRTSSARAARTSVMLFGRKGSEGWIIKIDSFRQALCNHTVHQIVKRRASFRSWHPFHTLQVHKVFHLGMFTAALRTVGYAARSASYQSHVRQLPVAVQRYCTGKGTCDLRNEQTGWHVR